MAKPLLSDEKWQQIQHLFPPPPARPKGGRRRLDYRCVLTGILFVLKTGIPWDALPLELGFGSGMTCWRRLRDWQHQGVWQRLLDFFLDELKQSDRLADGRLVVDSSLVPAKEGALVPAPTLATAANPVASITCAPTSRVYPWPPRSAPPISLRAPRCPR